ncbi:MAG: hypothetical protein K8I30_16980, partial [Anaerolineae bacterium]|nr:hypothetical protein [Anaerolineae bacterium]
MRYLKTFWVFGLLAIVVTAFPTAAQGFSVTCDSGVSFDNGVEVRVQQMRAGFNYTATAIGIDGFDPILAVLDANGRGLCADNTSEASGYSVDLPTTGSVSGSQRSAQINFSQTSGQNMADVSLVVGSEGNISGEFVLMLEGMAATSADGQGDPFAVRLTPDMVNSGVPLTVYMVSVTDDLDPMIVHIDSDYNVVQDTANNDMYCDDAGDADTCWGESVNLGSSSVTWRGGRRIGGISTDSMLSIPLTGIALNEDPDFNFY